MDQNLSVDLTLNQDQDPNPNPPVDIKEINKKNVSYKKVGVVKLRAEEFPKNTSRKITRFAIDKTID